MTRFEDCFPPDIVRAVYERIEREDADRRMTGADLPRHDNVLYFSAYRRALSIDARNVVS